MPTYPKEVVNLLESDEEGCVLVVWDGGGGAQGGNDDNSVVVLEDQHNEDTLMEDNTSDATIKIPAEFGYDNWRKFSDMHHPGRPNRMKVQRIRDLVIQEARNNFDVDLQLAPYYGDLPVCVKLCFYRRLPNSAFVNERRTNPLKQNWKHEIVGTPDVSRPDLDNMCKLIIDSLQGLLYKDDQLVAKIVATKF